MFWNVLKCHQGCCVKDSIVPFDLFDVVALQLLQPERGDAGRDRVENENRRKKETQQK